MDRQNTDEGNKYINSIYAFEMEKKWGEDRSCQQAKHTTKNPDAWISKDKEAYEIYQSTTFFFFCLLEFFSKPIDELRGYKSNGFTQFYYSLLVVGQKQARRK